MESIWAMNRSNSFSSLVLNVYSPSRVVRKNDGFGAEHPEGVIEDLSNNSDKGNPRIKYWWMLALPDVF